MTAPTTREDGDRLDTGGRGHGLVLGGGLAGMLAATALARHLDTVTLVERDVLPLGPGHRRGAPQAHHGHLFVAGGVTAVETLLPGITDRLLAAGAHRITLPDNAVTLSAYGWQHRFPATQFLISCGRHLLDAVVREQVRRDPRIMVLERTDVFDLTGDLRRVTGVSVRPQGGEVTELTADLVVDALGRGSQAARWLAARGAQPEEDVLDLRLRYATRIFQPPAGTTTQFPVVVNLFSDPRQPGAVRNAVMLPIEDDRWMLTMSGVRGGEPPTDDAGFLRDVHQLPHPLLAELIALAEPVTSVEVTRTTSNRRCYYERLDAWPDGFVVLGDAVAAFNPIYGHGMSAAALGAVALDNTLRAPGRPAQLARRAQQAIGAVVDEPWQWATAQDVQYLGAAGADDATPLDDQMGDFVELMRTAGPVQPVVSAALLDVHMLSAPQRSLQAPHVVSAARRGARRPVLTDPPLTDRERAFLRSASRTVAASGR